MLGLRSEEQFDEANLHVKLLLGQLPKMQEVGISEDGLVNMHDLTYSANVYESEYNVYLTVLVSSIQDNVCLKL